METSTSTMSGLNEWGSPELIQTNECAESIEMIYKQHSNMSNNFGTLPPRTFKIVFSCKDGKWNKSEPIFGKIVPAQNEYYDFED